MDKQYRLKYQGKWMKVIRATGMHLYQLVDDPNEIPPSSLNKVKAQRASTCEDNEIEISEVEIVEV